MRKALFRQVFIPALVLAGSIAYKFSFVVMDIPSIIQLDCGLVPLGGSARDWTVFSENMIDITEPNRVDAISAGRNGSDLIMGPSFNFCQADIALNDSRLHLCYPMLYARSMISTTSNTRAFPKRNITQSSTSSGIEFRSDDLGQVVDLSVTASQSLQALSGTVTDISTLWKYLATVTTNIC
jgi:hypothetical protein